jgi:NAD(P)-dependent dehydrogenase (short-subunit alcohol dehydrogenase family)
VSDEAFAEELVERAEQSYGHLDVAFNNAGILGEKGPTTAISLDGWNETLRVNLVGETRLKPSIAAREGR